ncbi:class IV lanthionine synthetase LanL [Glycomyces xiaoerkulensis]|uniref:class IV lanthionine synthetase LanL n=1 Tax=Glycomyces xiaoerkulensis TaxID=2038139 RepID=UPI0018E457EE|nr:class IV lanthionine synthetase LanL [Glycomyces xiaoerkulensis]
MTPSPEAASGHAEWTHDRTLGSHLLTDCAASVLESHGLQDWKLTEDGVWCHVRPPKPDGTLQGWKLHVSATPLSAAIVLNRVATVLAGHRYGYKFAKNLGEVQKLLSRQCERSAGGKFITVYPDGNADQLRDLAEELHQATRGLPGPGILSDRRYKPGSLVHYRYGAHHGVPFLGNDGDHQAMLIAPDGRLVEDERRPQYVVPAWAPEDPFRNAPKGLVERSAQRRPRSVRLNDRYTVTGAVRHTYCGGVYRADDERTGRSVIIKQAREHTEATVLGTDIQSRRRHEARMLTAFADTPRTPDLIEVFEQQSDLFVVLEEVQGVSLLEWVNDRPPVGDREETAWSPEPELDLARQLIDIVELVHDKGYTIRDLSPGNLMVTDDGTLRLIDLELLCRPGDWVTNSYTPGYAAPEVAGAEAAGPAPQQRSDLYGLGAMLFHLVAGLHPLMPAASPDQRPDHERIGDWLAAMGPSDPAVAALSGVIVDLMRDDPSRRPGPGEVRRRLAARTADRPAAGVPEPRVGTGDLDEWIADGLDWIEATVDLDDPSRLHRSGPFGRTTDACNVQHGAAGVLGVLNQAHRLTGDARTARTMAGAAEWIARRLATRTRILPGLQFGHSGPVWALAETADALQHDDLMERTLPLADRIPLQWPNPDLCHGATGAGMTFLRLWELTSEPRYLERLAAVARHLSDAAEERDGHLLWPIPADFESKLAGMAELGFAHGTAGVASLLLCAGQVLDERRFQDQAVRAAETLAETAEVEAGAAYWPTGGKSSRLTRWCTGSSGIGTYLVRAWDATGDDRYGKLAAQAAAGVHRGRWRTGTAQCHGLAGDSEFLLDLADRTGDEAYRSWARDCVDAVYARAATRDGRTLPSDESGTDVTADYGVGVSGVLSLLLRLRHGGSRLWLPATFDRIGR